MNMDVHMLNSHSYIFVKEQNKDMKKQAGKKRGIAHLNWGLYLYSFHWFCTLIEHFLQSFWPVIRCVPGTNTVLVFQVVGFAITLITLTVF